MRENEIMREEELLETIEIIDDYEWEENCKYCLERFQEDGRIITDETGTIIIKKKEV